MRLTKDAQTTVGLRVRLGSMLLDSDGFTRADEEKVLLSSSLLQLLEYYCDAQSLVSTIKGRGSFPFKGKGHTASVAEVKELYRSI